MLPTGLFGQPLGVAGAGNAGMPGTTGQSGSAFGSNSGSAFGGSQAGSSFGSGGGTGSIMGMAAVQVSATASAEAAPEWEARAASRTAPALQPTPARLRHKWLGNQDPSSSLRQHQHWRPCRPREQHPDVNQWIPDRQHRSNHRRGQHRHQGVHPRISEAKALQRVGNSSITPKPTSAVLGGNTGMGIAGPSPPKTSRATSGGSPCSPAVKAGTTTITPIQSRRGMASPGTSSI